MRIQSVTDATPFQRLGLWGRGARGRVPLDRYEGVVSAQSRGVGWLSADAISDATHDGCENDELAKATLPNAKRMAEEKGRRWGCCCRIQSGSRDCRRRILDVIE